MIGTIGATPTKHSPVPSSASSSRRPAVTSVTTPRTAPLTGRDSLTGWRAWMADRIGWTVEPPAEHAWRWAEPEAALLRARTLARRLDALADDLAAPTAAPGASPARASVRGWREAPLPWEQ